MVSTTPRTLPFGKAAFAPISHSQIFGKFLAKSESEMSQQIKSDEPAPQPNGPRDLLSRLYREIGISAVAAALESTRRPKPKQIEAALNPAVLRDEKAA